MSGYQVFFPFLSHYKGNVLLNNNTNFCVTIHGLYWHK